MDAEVVEEEEMLVVVEFAGNSGEEALKQEDPYFKVIGIDTEEPVMQIGNHLFTGEFCSTLGTELFFQAKENDETVDRIFEEKSSSVLEYLAKTNKKLVMKRVFALPKEAKKGTGNEGGPSTADAGVQPVSM